METKGKKKSPKAATNKDKKKGKKSPREKRRNLENGGGKRIGKYFEKKRVLPQRRDRRDDGRGDTPEGPEGGGAIENYMKTGMYFEGGDATRRYRSGTPGQRPKGMNHEAKKSAPKKHERERQNPFPRSLKQSQKEKKSRLPTESKKARGLKRTNSKTSRPRPPFVDFQKIGVTPLD